MCAAQQRAQDEEADGKQDTLWYLKSSRHLRKHRESKAECLVIALKAAVFLAASPGLQATKKPASSQISPYSSV